MCSYEYLVARLSRIRAALEEQGVDARAIEGSVGSGQYPAHRVRQHVRYLCDEALAAADRHPPPVGLQALLAHHVGVAETYIDLFGLTDSANGRWPPM